MPLAELLTILKNTYDFKFVESDYFAWIFEVKTVYYPSPAQSSVGVESYLNGLMHEVAHGILDHREFESDIDLLSKEAEAWSVAKILCKKYNIKFSESEAEKSLDSYRLWAGSRSECTNTGCKKTGLQVMKTGFECPSCNNSWKVGSSRFKRTYRN